MNHYIGSECKIQSPVKISLSTLTMKSLVKVIMFGVITYLLVTHVHEHVR